VSSVRQSVRSRSSERARVDQFRAVTVAFTLANDPKTSFIAWTTTPWTMPSNLALCVHPDLGYVKIHDVERDANFILCDKLLSCLYKDPVKAKKEKKYEVLETYKGTDLVGMEYEPLFPYFKERVSGDPQEIGNGPP
jgi:isoleucyl-tRNA synthetase